MPPNTPEKGNWMTTGARLALILLLTGCAPDSNNEEKASDGSDEQENQIEINLSNTETSDISKYQGKAVKYASLSYNDIKDLSPLEGSPLEHLDIAYTLIKDLEALRGNTTLQDLDIRGTAINDLSPVGEAPLTMIFLNESATDLLPIKDAIESGASVFPPVGWRINRKNWTLERIREDDGPPMKITEDDAGVMTLDFTG